MISPTMGIVKMAEQQPEDSRFAFRIEFGKDLGAGAYFNLANYYEMAEIIVQVLKEHTTLLKKQDALFKYNDHYYYDE